MPTTSLVYLFEFNETITSIFRINDTKISPRDNHRTNQTSFLSIMWNVSSQVPNRIAWDRTEYSEEIDKSDHAISFTLIRFFSLRFRIVPAIRNIKRAGR